MICPADLSPYPWLKYALQEYGTRTIPGPGTNARVGEYLRVVGLGPGDETAWCSAFANWCMNEAGITGTGSGLARSWLGWSEAKECLAMPVWGCVAILWRVRRDGPYGHVAFYVGSIGSKILLLGGNQANRVSCVEFSNDRVIGYRWPSSLPLPSSPF
jgi:uncharacterized protein (TIGR02594 family)